MVQFLVTLAFWLPITLFAQYAIIRFSRPPAAPPAFVQGWGRTQKATLRWVIVVLVFVSIVPSILLLGAVTGLNECSPDRVAPSPWICLPAGRLVLIYGFILVGVPAVTKLLTIAKSIVSSSEGPTRVGGVTQRSGTDG